METQDELFQLITSLSKSEKKFFTQYVNLYEKGSSPIYLQLFDFLNTEESYSDERIFKKFRDPQFKKTYAVTKHYLKNLIVKPRSLTFVFSSSANKSAMAICSGM